MGREVRSGNKAAPRHLDVEHDLVGRLVSAGRALRHAAPPHRALGVPHDHGQPLAAALLEHLARQEGKGAQHPRAAAAHEVRERAGPRGRRALHEQHQGRLEPPALHPAALARPLLLAPLLIEHHAVQRVGHFTDGQRAGARGVEGVEESVDGLVAHVDVVGQDGAHLWEEEEEGKGGAEVEAEEVEVEEEVVAGRGGGTAESMELSCTA